MHIIIVCYLFVYQLICPSGFDAIIPGGSLYISRSNRLQFSNQNILQSLKMRVCESSLFAKVPI